MEEQATVAGRSVDLQFEPRRDAAERLADAYRRLAPPPQEARAQTNTVQRHAGRSSAEQFVMEAVT